MNFAIYILATVHLPKGAKLPPVEVWRGFSGHWMAFFSTGLTALTSAYRQGVSPMIYKHGGEYLARGGAAELIEGDWTPSRVVLLKFPDMAALKSFLDDPEYQPLKDLRLRAADTQMLAVEGI